MKNLKELLLGFFRAVKKEYTRLDRTCNSCGREIFGGESIAEKYFCPDCAAHLPFNNGFICAHCGRSTCQPVDFCDDCIGYEWSYTAARSVFFYSYPIDKLIRNQKYDNRRYTSEIFADFLAPALVKYFSDADVLAFVPMTEKRLKMRGFNQTELMAKRLSALTGVPYVNALVKTSDTERQAKLGRDARLNNLKGSFKAGDKTAVAGKKVVLVDDVFTTGATAEACSAALKSAGANKVYVLTVASVTNRRVANMLGQSGNSFKKYKKGIKLLIKHKDSCAKNGETKSE